MQLVQITLIFRHFFLHINVLDPSRAFNKTGGPVSWLLPRPRVQEAGNRSQRVFSRRDLFEPNKPEKWENNRHFNSVY